MLSILIVDDEFGLAEMAGELLAMQGYSVTTAINGRLALATLNQSRPDIILLDVMMPVMSGPDVIRALKANVEYRDVPVVMMSAAGPGALPEDIRPLIAGFLQKPFSYDELTAALEAALASGA
jgi:DNA-binding response OmpR family regulator